MSYRIDLIYKEDTPGISMYKVVAILENTYDTFLTNGRYPEEVKQLVKRCYPRGTAIKVIKWRMQ